MRNTFLVVLAAATVTAGAATWSWCRRHQPVPAADGEVLEVRRYPVRISPPSTALPASEGEVAAIERLTPDAPPRWADLIHAIRLWGPKCVARWPQSPSSTLIEPLTDAALARRLFGMQMHEVTRNGVRFTRGSQAVRNGELHRDSTLATLGAVGVSSTQPLRGLSTSPGSSVADLVRCCAADLNLEQEEIEWSTVALALYLPPVDEWSNKFGQRMDFNALVRCLCTDSLDSGACYGTHRLYALAVVLAVDARYPILGGHSRELAHARLTAAASALLANQDPDGSWAGDWAGHSASEGRPAVAAPNALERLIVTSHSLEWLAIAPDGLSNRLDVPRARKFLLRAILVESTDYIRRNYCPYSHAAKALRLWHARRGPDSQRALATPAFVAEAT